jgi:hypothetical protein
VLELFVHTCSEWSDTVFCASADWAILALEFWVMLLLIGHMMGEVDQAYAMRWAYFTSFYNILDVCICLVLLTLSLLCCLLNFDRAYLCLCCWDTACHDGDHPSCGDVGMGGVGGLE